MKRLMLLMATAALLMTACEAEKKSPIAVKKEAINGLLVEYQIDTVRNVKQGYYKTFFENGKVSKEEYYVDGVTDSLEKIYHENGKLNGEFAVKKGKYDGPFKYYFPDGTLMQEGKHQNDALEGELKSYYPNKQLKETVTFSAGVENGPFVEYYENGKMKAKGTFVQKEGETGPKEHCLLELYKEDASGELASKMICREGACCTFWTAEKGDVKPSSQLCEQIIAEMEGQCPGIEKKKAGK